MAGVFSKSEDKPDLHEKCCFGDHPLQNPKLLPCQHSFCRECIKTKVGPHRKNFNCPKCQMSIPLSKKEINRLPDDFLYHILQKAKSKDADCDMCKFENKNIPGTFQCLDCSDILCDDCKTGHTKSSLTRSHSVVSLKEIQSGKYKNKLENAINLLCQTHSKPKTSMYLEYYCEECKCLACQICNLTQHQSQGHTCKSIDEIHEKKTKAITDHVTKLLGLRQLDEDFIVKLEQGQGESKTLREKLENEVYDRAALIIDIVEKVKQDKLTEIKGHFDKDDISMKTKLDKTKNRMICTDSIVSYTQTFLEHSDKAEFLQHENEIMKNLKENKRNNDRTLQTTDLEIDELQIEKIESVVSEAFGRIKVKKTARNKFPVEGASLVWMEGPRTTDSYPKKSASAELFEKTKTDNASAMKDVPTEWLRKAQILFSVDSGIGEARGLTVTENGDIVAVKGSIIQVYNSDGKSKERIKCSQLEAACGVVAKGDTLYVSDRDTEKVLVMDFRGNVKKIITLPHTVFGHGHIDIAVDDEDNVYSCSGWHGAVYKCGPCETNTTVFIQTQPHSLFSDYNLCITPGGELVVSNHTLNTVQVYNKFGELLWQYNGQGAMTLNSPMGVCCDSQGHIYISDYSNNRIQVVKDGKFQKSLTNNNLIAPWAIALDKENNIVCACKLHEGTTIVKCKVWK